jgi:hypothetical protein
MRFLNLGMHFLKTGTSSTNRGRRFHETQMKKGKNPRTTTNDTSESTHRAIVSIDIPPTIADLVTLDHATVTTLTNSAGALPQS